MTALAIILVVLHCAFDFFLLGHLWRTQRELREAEGLMDVYLELIEAMRELRDDECTVQ